MFAAWQDISRLQAWFVLLWFHAAWGTKGWKAQGVFIKTQHDVQKSFASTTVGKASDFWQCASKPTLWHQTCLTWLATWNVPNSNGIYFTTFGEIACEHYLETWQVIGPTFCLSHSQQVNQIFSLQVAPPWKSATLPIGGFLLLSQLNTTHLFNPQIGVVILRPAENNLVGRFARWMCNNTDVGKTAAVQRQNLSPLPPNIQKYRKRFITYTAG